MCKRRGSYPRIRVSASGAAMRGRLAGREVLRVETVRRIALDSTLSAMLEPWRKRRAVHDPGKVLLDLALAVALGDDCLCDIGVLRAEPDTFGPVAEDPAVSRLIDALAAAGLRALTAIRRARSEVRERARKLDGDAAPDAGGQAGRGPAAARERRQRHRERHIETARQALARLPKEQQRGRRTLIRTDSAGGSHDS